MGARGSSAVHSEPIPAYDEVREARLRARAAMTPGDPEATAEAIHRLVDADEPPLRLFLGTMPLPTIERIYADRLETWRAWRDVADAAQGAQRPANSATTGASVSAEPAPKTK